MAASSSKAIVSYRTGKRYGENTDLFIRDLRERLLGSPEISADGWRHYPPAIRDAFGNSVTFGQIVKTYSVVNLAVKEAARRYSPAEVIAVSRDVVTGIPANISTSHVERSHLSLRMANKRFARLGNGFSKRLPQHAAAVSLYVGHYNLCRVHEALTPSAARQTTPAMAAGIADHVWSIGELLDASLALGPVEPTTTAPERRRQFRVIQGGRAD